MTENRRPTPQWLPDPWRDHDLRWWDGMQWTTHVADRRGGRRSKNTGLRTTAIVLGCVLFLAIGFRHTPRENSNCQAIDFADALGAGRPWVFHRIICVLP